MLDEYRGKNSQIASVLLANQIQQLIKTIIHHDQLGFIPEVQV